MSDTTSSWRILYRYPPIIELQAIPFDPAPIAPAGKPIADKEDPLPENGVLTVRLVHFLRSNESSLMGYEVQERAVAMETNGGQRMALLFLHNRGLIPEYVSEDIYFPATTYQDASKRYGVLKLSKNSVRWDLEYVWLGVGWYGGYLVQIQ